MVEGDTQQVAAARAIGDKAALADEVDESRELAAVLFEGIVYDADGTPRTDNLGQYLRPSAADLPTIAPSAPRFAPQDVTSASILVWPEGRR